MTVQRIWAGGNTYHINGVGFKPEGEILSEGGEPLKLKKHGALEKCLRVGLLANESGLGFTKERGYYPEGDPTEVALIVAANKAGVETESQTILYPKIDEIPFESNLMYMATLHKNPSGNNNLIFVKGAPEQVLDMCDFIVSSPEGNESPLLDRELIYEKVRTMSLDGLRVLAMAYRKVPEEVKSLDDTTMKKGFTLIGVQGMMDPPREEVFEAVNQANGNTGHHGNR